MIPPVIFIYSAVYFQTPCATVLFNGRDLLSCLTDLGTAILALQRTPPALPPKVGTVFVVTAKISGLLGGFFTLVHGTVVHTYTLLLLAAYLVRTDRRPCINFAASLHTSCIA